MQHVNRLPRNRLPRVMKHSSLTGKRIMRTFVKAIMDIEVP